MKRAMGIALFCAVNICVFFATNVSAELMVESTIIESATPRIDGDLSDWTGEEEESNKVNFITLDGTEIVSTIADWESDEDFSASIAFVHNKQALYFAATITDELIVHNQKTYKSKLRLTVISIIKFVENLFEHGLVYLNTTTIV